MSPDLLDAHRRVAGLAEGRLLAPPESYATTRSFAGAVIASDGVSLDRVATPTGPQLYVKGKGNVVLVGAGAVLPAAVRFHGDDNLVVIGPGADCAGAVCVLVGDGNLLTIGADTTTEKTCTFILSGPNGRIAVGEDCAISDGAILGNSDGHAIYDAATGMRLNADREVVLEDHVLIGRGVRVNKGARIGRGAVVDHYAILHGTVAPGTLMAGIPAAAVREGVAWARERARDAALPEPLEPGDPLAAVEDSETA